MPQSGEPASLSALLGSHAMERNLARIGPIIALNRVPANRTSWSKQLSAGPFGEIRASCTALGG
ncbi:hypothetical protein, partial [Deinococcus piscis]|uniref:hypothetical protein n=1 Tax=Deinococcus piscis TaxID=394230 RepID=UPI0016794DDE